MTVHAPSSIVIVTEVEKDLQGASCISQVKEVAVAGDYLARERGLMPRRQPCKLQGIKWRASHLPACECQIHGAMYKYDRDFGLSVNAMQMAEPCGNTKLNIIPSSERYKICLQE